MRRDQLEHLIRAAGAVLGEQTVIIIGSQAILASFPDPSAPDLTRSMEADILPLDDPDGTKADLVDGVLGAGSIFDDSFGVHADGVGPETAVLPAGWRDRLVPVLNANTNGITGLCLEAHDLVVSKLAAGRHKDTEFARAAIGDGLVGSAVLRHRIQLLDVDDERRALIEARLDRLG